MKNTFIIICLLLINNICAMGADWAFTKRSPSPIASSTRGPLTHAWSSKLVSAAQQSPLELLKQLLANKLSLEKNILKTACTVLASSSQVPQIALDAIEQHSTKLGLPYLKTDNSPELKGCLAYTMEEYVKLGARYISGEQLSADETRHLNWLTDIIDDSQIPNPAIRDLIVEIKQINFREKH